MSLLSRIISRFRRPQTNALEQLLAAATTDESRRPAFYQALCEAALCIPGEMVDGELLIRPYDLEGRKTLLVFTSPERMAEGLRERPAFFSINARTLFESLPPFDSLILNYRTRWQKEVTPSELRALLDGSIVRQPTNNDGIILGQPKEYPVRLMNALREKLPARPEVHAAYLAQMFQPGVMESPRIVIAFDADMDEAAFDMLCANATKLAKASGSEDVMFMRLADDGLGEYLRREAGAFYKF